MGLATMIVGVVCFAVLLSVGVHSIVRDQSHDTTAAINRTFPMNVRAMDREVQYRCVTLYDSSGHRTTQISVRGARVDSVKGERVNYVTTSGAVGFVESGNYVLSQARCKR